MTCVVVATGHRIDASDRSTPRFSPAAEAGVAASIGTALDDIMSSSPIRTGIAAGANGADLLFHEACRDRSIRCEMHLALPPHEFVKRSVQGCAGSGWTDRFVSAFDRAAEHDGLYTLDAAGPSIWQQANLSMLDRGVELTLDSTARRVLLAVWNGAGGDGPGGTADMVAAAKQRGYEILILPVDGDETPSTQGV